MTKHFKSLVSIVIPTYKRHNFLTRALDYYKDCGLSIFIADSTPERFKNESKFQCNYFHYPNLHVFQKILEVLKKIKTPYIVFCADDDFIVPSTILKCVEFLEKNKEYSVAEGRLIGFDEITLKGNIGFNHLRDNCDYYNEGDIKERLYKILKVKNDFYLNCFYSVHRTDHICDTFNYLKNNEYYTKTNPEFITCIVEFTLLFFTHIRGKYKNFPFFYGARSHGPCVEPSKLKTFHQIDSIELEILKKTVLQYLMEYHPISFDDANSLFDNFFEHWYNYYTLPRSLPQKITSLQRIKKAIKRFLPKKILIFKTSLSNNLHNLISFIANSLPKGYPLGRDKAANYEWRKIKEVIKKHRGK